MVPSSLLFLAYFNNSKLFSIYFFIFKMLKLNWRSVLKLSCFSVSKHFITFHFFSLSPPSSFMMTSSQFCFHSSTFPSLHSQSFCNIPFLSSQTRSYGSVEVHPSCVNFCKWSVGAEPQSSFRMLILGEDVHTGTPKLSIEIERLWFLLSPPNK
jgi:hypothetical protein